MTSKHSLAYRDDVTLGGPESQVAQDVKTIRRMGEEIGLLLNDKKCEFISRSAVSVDPAFRHFAHLCTEEAELLGAPLTVGSAMDTALSSRCDNLTKPATRLGSIAAHAGPAKSVF